MGRERVGGFSDYNRPTSYLEIMKPGTCMTVKDAKLQMMLSTSGTIKTAEYVLRL